MVMQLNDNQRGTGRVLLHNQARIVFIDGLKPQIKEIFRFRTTETLEDAVILEHELDQLTDSILFVKNNVLHPFILTPDQFLNELIESLRHIPQDLSFPIKLEINDIPILLKVIKIQTALINNKIILSISIPLISNVHFDLFKLYPLPIKIKNSYSYIQPDFEFLVYSEIKNLYSHLDTLDSCSETKKTNFICPFKNPLTNIPLEPICETEILNSINEFPKSCKALNIKHDKEIWHQLINKNIWIYLVPQPTRLTIKCNSNKTFVEILTACAGKKSQMKKNFNYSNTRKLRIISH